MRAKNLTLLLSVVGLAFTIACGGKRSSPSATAAKPATPPAPAQQTSPSAPAAEAPAAPTTSHQQHKVRVRPTNLIVELVEKNGKTFNENILVHFLQVNTPTTLQYYTFKKSFLGTKDNWTWFGAYDNDDLVWDGPWQRMSVNLDTMQVFGGENFGQGVQIGEILYDGTKFRMVLSANYTIDKANRQVQIIAPNTPPVPPQLPPVQAQAPAPAAPTVSPPLKPAEVECPWGIMGKTCELYKGVFQVFSAIDFSAMGEVGPSVLEDLLKPITLSKLALSFWKFDTDIDKVRSEYLIPMLKMIGQLKALGKTDKTNRPAYLEKARKTYVNTVYTATDISIKTQKIMPDALPTLKNSAMGALLGYIGAEGAGDYVISRKQPKWFQETVAPVVREAGILLIDLILNGTKTPLEQRLNRFIALEVDLRKAIIKLCNETPGGSADNECLAALNQQ